MVVCWVYLLRVKGKLHGHLGVPQEKIKAPVRNCLSAVFVPGVTRSEGIIQRIQRHGHTIIIYDYFFCPSQKPYACQVPGCPKRYTDPSSLRKHFKQHANGKMPQANASGKVWQQQHCLKLIDCDNFLLKPNSMRGSFNFSFCQNYLWSNCQPEEQNNLK